jgi:stringent starvation protein B
VGNKKEKDIKIPRHKVVALYIGKSGRDLIICDEEDYNPKIKDEITENKSDKNKGEEC